MPAETLSPRRVIRLTVEAVRQDAEVYLLLALLLVAVPAWLSGTLAALDIAQAEAGDEAMADALLWRVMAMQLATLSLGGLLQVVLIHRAWSLAEDRPLPLSAELARALRRLPALLALMLLEGLAIGAGLGLMFAAMPRAASAPAGPMLLIGLGLLVLGVLLLCRWAVALPVLAVEQAGPVQALRRSTGMTRGHRRMVLATGAAFVAINLALLSLLGLLTGPVALLATLAGGAANAALSVLNAVGMTVLYRELSRLGPAA